MKIKLGKIFRILTAVIVAAPEVVSAVKSVKRQVKGKR